MPSSRTNFGKKKLRSVKKGTKKVRSIKKSSKPSARLLKLCKKYHIKTTRRVGGKKVYKSARVLKKACLKRARKLLKRLKLKIAKRSKRSKLSKHSKRSSKKHRKVTRRRCMSFGLMGSAFENPKNYGYNQPVKQNLQTLSQTNSVVNEKLNASRPDNMQMANNELPVYGTYADFFGQDVPRTVPPEWNFMGQPDGSLYPVGAPFYAYRKPITGFGKKKLRRVSKRSACSRLRKKQCSKSPMCRYVKRRGCRRARKAKAPGYVMSGDDDLGAYGEEAGISFFGRRRKRRIQHRVDFGGMMDLSKIASKASNLASKTLNKAVNKASSQASKAVNKASSHLSKLTRRRRRRAGF